MEDAWNDKIGQQGGLVEMGWKWDGNDEVMVAMWLWF